MRQHSLVTRSILAFALLAFPASSALAATKSASTRKDMALVAGLDHVTYESYKPSLVKKVQTALKADGLYQGEINGVLDRATMKAIGEFQAKHHLAVSGIPSPHTREELLKG